MCRVRNEQLIKFLPVIGGVRSERRLVPNYKNNGRVWYLREANSHFVYNLRLKWNIVGGLRYSEMFTFFYLRYFNRIRFVVDRWSEVGYLFDMIWRIQFIKQRRLAIYIENRLVENTLKRLGRLRIVGKRLVKGKPVKTNLKRSSQLKRSGKRLVKSGLVKGALTEDIPWSKRKRNGSFNGQVKATVSRSSKLEKIEEWSGKKRSAITALTEQPQLEKMTKRVGNERLDKTISKTQLKKIKKQGVQNGYNS